jgi:hypothetical protein
VKSVESELRDAVQSCTEPPTPDDLARVAALARRAGEHGLPASQVLAMTPPAVLGLVADAHQSGALLRRDRWHEAQRRTAIVETDAAVVGFFSGPPSRPVLDRDLPVVLQRAIGRQAAWAVADVGSVAPHDELLAHTLAGWLALDVPTPPRRVVSGVDGDSELAHRCRKLTGTSLHFTPHVGPLLTQRDL